VRFAKRIREMLPFSSVEALIARMHEDVAETRAILADVREG
jgi:riboflavin kinase/FMN adenylyltransferase